MFRYTAVMNKNVDALALQRALDRMRIRFPMFYVKLKKGLFWNFIEETHKRALVQKDTLHPCPPVQSNELPFRVKTHNNRIAMEFAHYVCDGGGALYYFITLLAQYLREQGENVPPGGYVLDLTKEFEKEELEDAFLRYAHGGTRPKRREPRAFKLTGTHMPPGVYCVTTGIIGLKEALELSRKKNVSLTEYMVGILIYVLYTLQRAQHPKGKLLPIKISVPVNLRKYYNTKTLRNFSQYLNPGIDPGLGEFTLDEIIEQVHHYFRFMFTEKNLNARISQNVDAQLNILLRVTPLFLKKWGIRLVYEMTGENMFTSVLSNVGPIKTPPIMERHISRMDFLLCTAKHNAIEAAMASYNGKLSITFTRSIAESHVERLFFKALVHQGLHVLVESNQQ